MITVGSGSRRSLAKVVTHRLLQELTFVVKLSAKNVRIVNCLFSRAVVEYGNVTALAKGKATITVTAANGKKAKVKIKAK